jgi:membrane protein
VLTSGLFTTGKYALALYFRFASPTSAFGAAGSLAAVILWVYYSSFILFFGAEFTKVWSAYHLDDRVVPEEHAVKITEEDRAQQGIPTEKRMNDALAGRLHDNSAKPTLLPVPRASHSRLGLGAFALATGGLIIGTIIGALWGRSKHGSKTRSPGGK